MLVIPTVRQIVRVVKVHLLDLRIGHHLGHLLGIKQASRPGRDKDAVRPSPKRGLSRSVAFTRARLDLFTPVGANTDLPSRTRHPTLVHCLTLVDNHQTEQARFASALLRSATGRSVEETTSRNSAYSKTHRRLKIPLLGPASRARSPRAPLSPPTDTTPSSRTRATTTLPSPLIEPG